VTASRSIVALGEILWDLFPSGARFGGAPANFASSAAELAGDSCHVSLVSGVGRDELGQQAIAALQAHGVDTSCVATLDRPTGTVDVTLDAGGSASYVFAIDTAWDAVAWTDDLGRLAAGADAVCFGTLGQRAETSRGTILRFVRSVPSTCLRVLDINYRPPFWSDRVVLESLALADVLKLNDAELPILAQIVGIHGGDEELLRQLIDRYRLRLVALTRGAAGALLLDASGACSDLAAPTTKVIDTVGAGDSFTAALVIGLLSGLPLDAMNAWGNRVAAYVASQAGAAPHLPAEYLRP